MSPTEVGRSSAPRRSSEHRARPTQLPRFAGRRPAQVRALPPRGAHPVRRTAGHRLLATARSTRPLEPILFPKLRIRFADFPYLHCSIGQRLFTSETCCGYGYDLARKSFAPTDFQGPARAHRTRQDLSRSAALNSLSPGEPIPGQPRLNEKRKLFPGLEPASPCSFASPPVSPKRDDLRVEVRES